MKESMKEIMARLKPRIEVAQTSADFHEIAQEILGTLDGEETIEKVFTAASFGLVAVSLRIQNTTQQPPQLSFSVSLKENDIVVVELSGDLCGRAVKELSSKINDLIAEGHEKFVLDISEVQFINLTALKNAVVDLNERVRVIIVGHDCSLRSVEEAMKVMCSPRQSL